MYSEEYDDWNSAVLRSRRNCSSDGAERTDDGRAFHTRAAVTGKTLTDHGRSVTMDRIFSSAVHSDATWQCQFILVGPILCVSSCCLLRFPGILGPTRSLYLGSLNQASAELSSAESSTNAQQRWPHTQQTSLVARCAETADGGLAVLPLFHIFNDFCQTDYLNTHRTNIRQIFRVGRTTAVDDQSEIIVFRSLRDVAMATNCWLASSTQVSSCENCATCTIH